MVILNVSDQGSPPQTGYATVRVRIEDVNDHTPVFDPAQLTTATVSESAQPGEVVLDVRADDLDSEENGRIDYGLKAGSGDVPFYVDKTNGRLYVNGTLDRETKASWALRIEATDQGSPSRSTEIQVSDAFMFFSV